MRTKWTTGLLPVLFSGGEASLRLAVSSEADRPQTVRFTVRWVRPSGIKALLHDGVLTVGPGETAGRVFDDVAGRTVEVNLHLPHPGLVPSVAVVGTFQADGAEAVLAWAGPGRAGVRSPVSPAERGRRGPAEQAGAGTPRGRGQRPRARRRRSRRNGRRTGQ